MYSISDWFVIVLSIFVFWRLSWLHKHHIKMKLIILSLSLTWMLVTNAQTYSYVAFRNDCICEHSANSHVEWQLYVASSIFEPFRSKYDPECVRYQWRDIFCRCMFHRLPVHKLMLSYYYWLKTKYTKLIIDTSLGVLNPNPTSR